MNEKLDDQLVKKYPKIFKDRHSDMRTTAMCWGFECGDGWFWLIDKLCDRIQHYIDDNQIYHNISQFVASQVKEKYGGLRFYGCGGDTLIEGMIWLAEDLSFHICEKCGSIENIGQTDGWIITLCKKCALKDSLNNWKEYENN